MYKDNKIALVIPALNEERLIGATLEADLRACAPSEGAQRELLARLAQPPAAGAEAAEGGPAEYTGAANYTDFRAGFKKPDQKPGNKYGPMKATAAIRWSVRVDYQPDVCKDYKETGFCGWGDACKFLHDRSDYKSGWQLDKMWEEEQKALKHQEALVALGEAEAAKKTDPADHLPFACLICREPWHAGSHPVQTKCEHYFCERCAIEHFQKSRRCFACSEQTGGVFNKAKAIQEKIDRLKAAQEVASAEDMTQEQLNAEYEASKESSKRRGYTGGWGYVG